MNFARRTSQFATLLAILLLSQAASAQSTGTVTQTVNQRNTIGAVTVSPTSGLTTGDTATFSYTLHTAGAPVVTTETVQFMDGATPIGTAQTLGSLAGSNLLPYSQVDTGHSWTTTGTAPPTLTINTGTGPDGSTSSATQVVYPSTLANTSAMFYAVPSGTNYANLPMTLSVWAKSAAPTTLTLTLADNPSVAASQSSTCAVTSTWQRCTLTYTFPAGAGTGFSVALASVGVATQTISLWGVQVEQAASAGPYVSTIGTARPTGGAGGTVSFPYALLQPGTHTITVVYAGDANFVGSTSNALTVVVSDETPPIALTVLPVSPQTYGTSVTFTAVVTTPAGNPGDVPSGTITFLDGATTLGSGAITMVAGSASVTLSGASALAVGSHSITAVYSGDTHFTTVTSTILTYVVTKVSATVTPSSSPNPSTYGDSVTFSVTVSSLTGATPTGTVLVVDTTTSTTLGTITLVGGTGSLPATSLLTAGTHTITFTYSGDSNYN